MKKETFGQYLAQLRKEQVPKKVSQGKLASVIGVTRQYIDNIEKNKCNALPPNFNQCILLAHKLGLEKSQRDKLIWLAFQGRIQRHWSFIEYLSEEVSQINKVPESNDELESIKKDNKESFCQFFVQWTTRYKDPILDTEMQQFVCEVINEQVLHFGYQLLGLHCSNALIQIEFFVDPYFKADEFISGLKELTARAIKNKFIQNKYISQKLWDKGYAVTTTKERLPYTLDTSNPILAKSAIYSFK